MPWSVAYTLIPQIIIYFSTHLSFKKTKKHEAVGRWVHVESTKKAQVRACANNITRRIYHETNRKTSRILQR
nr:MAG TPA: hypothetical protein [Caudoviricetes sp.]